jgi:hypothetical protein
MSFTATPDDLSAAYRPIIFVNTQTSSENVESAKVEVTVNGSLQVTYRKPYTTKAGDDYTFNIDVQTPVQRALAPRTDAAAASSIFPAASGGSSSDASDCYATFEVDVYLEYRSSAGLLVTSTAAETSSGFYAFAAKRPASDTTMTAYYYQGSGKFKWLTDGPSAQKIGTSEPAALCSARKGWNQYLFKLYDSAGSQTTSAAVPVIGVGADPKMEVLDGGTANLAYDFAGVSYYTVELANSGTVVSEPWRFDIVRRCAHAKRMYWMNSLGGVDQYTFEGQITKIHTHGGEIGEINQPIPTDSDLPGIVKTGIVSEVKYKVLEVMDATTADWVRNMFISPEVYMEIDSKLWRVTVEPGSVDIDTSSEAQQEIEFTVLFENEITQEV